MKTLASLNYTSKVPAADRIPSSCLKVLLTILQAADRDESLSNPEIARRLGWKAGEATMTGHNLVFLCLRRLRAADLISFEDGQRRTIRPTCRLTMWKEYLP